MIQVTFTAFKDILEKATTDEEILLEQFNTLKEYPSQDLVWMDLIDLEDILIELDKEELIDEIEREFFWWKQIFLMEENV